MGSSALKKPFVLEFPALLHGYKKLPVRKMIELDWQYELITKKIKKGMLTSADF